MQSYVVSKKFAEKAVFEFRKTVKPAFRIATVVLPFIYGPIIHKVSYPNFGSSMAAFHCLMSLPSDSTDFQDFCPAVLGVRDAARVHVAALKKDSINNGRWFPISTMADNQAIVDIIHKYRPEQAAQVTKGLPGTFKGEEYFKYDISRTLKAFDMVLIPFEKTIIDEYDSMTALKKESEARKA